MNNFQERLNELIIENNINRLKLANAIKVSSTTINGYFNDNYFPQLDIAIRLADYFNCSLDYLFGRSDNYTNTNTNNNAFIDNYNYLLKINKVSIARSLREMNMSEYNYYRWKAGIVPKTINLLEIADYFDTSLDFLIGRAKK